MPAPAPRSPMPPNRPAAVRERLQERLLLLRWGRMSYPRAYWDPDRDATQRPGWVMQLWWFWRESFGPAGRSTVWLLLFVVALEMFPGYGGPTLWIAFLLPALLAARLLTLRRPRALRTELSTPAPVRAGGVAQIPVRLTHTAGVAFSQGRTTVADPGVLLWRPHESLTPVGEAVHTAELLPGTSVDLLLPVQVPRRGVFPLRGAVALVPDPIGLMRARQATQSAAHLIVWPRLLEVDALAFLRAGESGVDFARALAGESREPEVIGLRPFRDGDSPRDVDQRAWARRGQRVSKERGGDVQGGIALAIDVGTARFADRALVDPLLELAAGIAAWLERQQAFGGLYAQGHPIKLPAVGRHEALLDALAALPRGGWARHPAPVEDWSCLPTGEPALLLSCGVHKKSPNVGGKHIRVVWSSDESDSSDAQLRLLDVPVHRLLQGRVAL